jgi:hypothetical protein
MNYGEELTSWYLRFNGFFPLSNFVIHKSKDIAYQSDVDVLAVRPPHVVEAIGGLPDDWDPYLTTRVPFDRLVGLVCEVKTGRFEETEVFRQEYLRYAIGRLGLVASSQVDASVAALVGHPCAKLNGEIGVAKLLVTADEHAGDSYLNLTLGHVEGFLAARVSRYLEAKYASRLFFPSVAIQLLIHQAQRTKLARQTDDEADFER